MGNLSKLHPAYAYFVSILYFIYFIVMYVQQVTSNRHNLSNYQLSTYKT